MRRRAARADLPEALVEQGLQSREARRDEEALAKFERAHAIAPTPRTRAQIALAEQALGRWAAAEVDLAGALASKDPWIAKHRATLEAALGTIRAHLGDLVVSGGIEGAEVTVDGARVGALPLAGPLRLEVGTHTLEVARHGFYPVSKPVAIVADAPARVALDMLPRSSGERDTPPPPPPIATIQPPPAVQPPASPPSRSSLGFTVAGVGVGVAGLGLVGLGIGGIAARGAQVSAYNEDATCPPIDAPSKPAPCQARVDSARTWETVGIVGFVAGAALVSGGAAVVLLGALGGSGPKAAFGCVPSYAGLVCDGRF